MLASLLLAAVAQQAPCAFSDRRTVVERGARLPWISEADENHISLIDGETLWNGIPIDDVTLAAYGTRIARMRPMPLTTLRAYQAD